MGKQLTPACPFFVYVKMMGLQEIQLTDLQQVESVMQNALHAANSYKSIGKEQKADFLEEIAKQIELLGNDLIQTAMAETNLPEARLVGERGRTCNQLRMFASMVREGSWVEASIDTAQPQRLPLPKPDLRKMLIPLGPVVVFGASNFPLAFSTAGGDTASALAAGCPVIVKAHSAHRKTSVLVASAIAKAIKIVNVPENVFQHVVGRYDIGQALVKHPVAQAVAFTGSFTGGKALFDIANQRHRPIPVFAEMGSVNPVCLLPEKLEGEAVSLAKELAASITQGVGQFCTNPGLMIAIESDALVTFTEHLKEAIHQVAPAKMLHPGIAQSYHEGISSVFSDEDLTVLAAVDKIDDESGNALVATVPALVFLERPSLHQEIFGPYSLLVKCKDKAEMLAVVNALEGQLTATIMGTESDINQYTDLLNKLTSIAGRVMINNVPTGVEVCPSMVHGGPFPATTDARFTSVGTSSVKRFVRPVCFQNFSQSILPLELQDGNPGQIWRLVDGVFSKS
ncbi:aldehyde dehydrogenase (NADP(+)) [Solitalea lacus]|uniref:aldehyde dehydrogenase (NADP(+)) n=1 Tax=Solitalea lacus TaxID=2911172 RepID=UPI001EDA6526|nr:aldehyde dehydrogenase (NADP(+)) [Solitalea lacus]UKJ08985.1 aldehyde dehydrogenase (NADP(+)) [Solitalea lacus]